MCLCMCVGVYVRVYVCGLCLWINNFSDKKKMKTVRFAKEQSIEKVLNMYTESDYIEVYNSYHWKKIF